MTGAAPSPFACMMLADMGAEVLRVDRGDAVGRTPVRPIDPLARSRRAVAVDAVSPAGAQVVLRLATRADVLIEGFRPGVMERLGPGAAGGPAPYPRLVCAARAGRGPPGA